MPLLAGLCFGSSCSEEPEPADGASAAALPATPSGAATPSDEVHGGDLVDEAASRGLDYRNVSGRANKPTVLEANGAGVALLDLGADGDLDVVFAQGLPDLDALVAGPGADLEPFENDGAGRFVRAEGPGLGGWWTGLATGDVDGDGRADLVAAGFGDLALCLQDGTGALREAPDALAAAFERPGSRFSPGRGEAGAPAPWWATSVALLDADRDGALDLYVGRYLDLDPLDLPLGELGEGALALPCTWKGHEVYCGPRGLVPQPDALLSGDGRGGFAERSARWLDEPGGAGFTLGVAAFDADLDGDTDLYVANDSVSNRLLVNEIDGATGAFRDRAAGAGVAVSLDGLPEAGMGIAVGDVNRDGRFDLAVTNFSDEPTHLYVGSELGFDCATHRMGLGNATRRLLSWGTHLDDFDGDGRLELFTANGHVYPQADEPGTGTSYGQADTLFRLDGPRVETIEPRSDASVLAGATVSRGSAVGDLDGDGALDLVVTRLDAPAALGRNTWPAGRTRLSVRCLGPRSPAEAPPRTPPDGTGARVIVVPTPPPGSPPDAQFALLAETQTSRGYQSASSPWLHFGLGASGSYSLLRVLWPSGGVEELPAGEGGRRLTIREGEGIVASEELAR